MLKKVLLTVMAAALMGGTVTGCDRNELKQEVAHSSVSTKIEGRTMGTFYAVNVVGGFKGGESALRELADSTFKEICDEISTFDSNATLYRFNDFRSTQPFEVSPYLGQVIQDVVYYGRKIEGATDISVGPLVNLWGFGKDKKLNRAPTQEQIDEAKKLVGLDKFELRSEKGRFFLKKSSPEVRLDLATVGEGLGADALSAKLINLGYRNFMVNVAGASRSFGVNAQGRKWKLGIEDPSTAERRVYTAVCALDKAVTTAGSYRNFFKDDESGKIYSHAIDPKTGYPVSHSTLSVTVIADTAFEADALDTGLLVLGSDKALSFGQKYGYAIATIEYKDGKTVMRYTDSFKKYLDCGQDK
ncbi:MAG: FAD:protein FMN transferase [Succinivibrio sp.]